MIPSVVTERRSLRMLLGLLLLVAATASVWLSVDLGAPAKLPDIALDDTRLFHAERALALFLPFLIGLAVVVRGFLGYLPISIGREGLGYPEEKIVATSRDITRATRQALRLLEATLEEEIRLSGVAITGATSTELDELRGQLTAIRDRLDAIEGMITAKP